MGCVASAAALERVHHQSRGENTEDMRKVAGLFAFVQSDPMGYVFSYLGPRDQGALRSCATLFCEAFQAAVWAEIHISRCGSKTRIDKRADFGTASCSWFPLSDKRSQKAPTHLRSRFNGLMYSQEKDRLGTIAVNLDVILNGSRHLPDNFLRRCIAHSILYFCAGQVTSAGDGWMTECPNVTRIDMEGFSALKTIGNGWLRTCGNLRSVGFEGLDALTTVGDYWLSSCTNLTLIIFEGLRVLTTVGDGWLSWCNCLTSVSFGGVSALRTVGHDWLSACPNLTSITFQGLSALTAVGNEWMYNCRNLSLVCFEGLHALKTVGAHWLRDCPNLTSISFKGLSTLTKVGDWWLCECKKLTFICLDGLSALTIVGRRWLDQCPRIHSVNFTGSSNTALARRLADSLPNAAYNTNRSRLRGSCLTGIEEETIQEDK